ncbi:unnamed protein product [Ceutorhynchus assimilis]|uniref:Uncharacterized protein n=1 Tax=Ceutorhynchus assimilis TaxID=467358 RepID=A0A9N9MAR8_9CUCU|nr:unnamed protein product [Ceutorhynchus assimilis]
MATTNRLYILVAFVFSSVAAIFNIVSLGTEYWITGTALWINSTSDTSEVTYGLFQGIYKRNVAFPYTYEITMTCDFANNICALLCGLDKEERGNLLSSLYNNSYNPNYSMDNCPIITRTSYYHRSFEDPAVYVRQGTYVSPSAFINAGVWLSTLIFLLLATIVGLLAANLALYNTVANPINFFLGVKSLYIYNSVAFCSTVMYVTLWGSMYIQKIFHNLSIFDTLVGNFNSDKTAFLGYSYWISFISMAFYIGSMGILYYREYLNERDPRQKRVALDTEMTDPNLYLY